MLPYSTSSNSSFFDHPYVPAIAMSTTLLNSVTAASAEIINTARSLSQNYDDTMMKIGALDEFTKKSNLTQWTDNHKVGSSS